MAYERWLIRAEGWVAVHTIGRENTSLGIFKERFSYTRYCSAFELSIFSLYINLFHIYIYIYIYIPVVSCSWVCDPRLDNLNDQDHIIGLNHNLGFHLPLIHKICIIKVCVEWNRKVGEEQQWLNFSLFEKKHAYIYSYVHLSSASR